MRVDWSKIEHFTADEFKCTCCGVEKMDRGFVETLDRVRETLGFPLVITSGYRCSTWNQQVSSTGPSGPHTTGKAADIALSYVSARRALTVFTDVFNGIGINQKGAKRFIHVDDLGERVWTY